MWAIYSVPAWRAAGIGLAALMLLAGCGKTPKGQVLAIVDGEDITIQQLEAELEDIVIPEGIDRKRLSRTLLEGVIDRQLEVAEARRQGLHKTSDFLALKKRNEEELLASMMGHKAALTVPLPLAEEVRNYIEAHPLQFAHRQRLVFDQLSFAPPRDRRRLAVALADAHSLEEAAAALHAIGIVTDPGQSAIDTGQSNPDLAKQLVQAPAGEPILLPQGDRLMVGVITAREPIDVPKDAAHTAAARAVRAADLLRESQAQIAAARAKADIDYEAGWEPEKTPVARR